MKITVFFFSSVVVPSSVPSFYWLPDSYFIFYFISLLYAQTSHRSALFAFKRKNSFAPNPSIQCLIHRSMLLGISNIVNACRCFQLQRFSRIFFFSFLFFHFVRSIVLFFSFSTLVHLSDI